MNNGKKPDNSEQPRVSVLQLEQDDLVIFGVDGEFHHVPKAYYATPEQRLPDRFRSAPEFVVGLGAVVADVTAYKSAQLDGADGEPMTAGCSCIVLNMAAIRQESEKHKDPRARHTLANGHSAQATSAPPEVKNGAGLCVEEDDLVIFGEDGNFYWVRKEYYEKQKLPDDMKSAPQLMVELGTVVADIPRLPTAGSACQLVNLASIRKGSTYVAERIRQKRLAVPGAAKPVEHRVQVQARRGSGPGGSRRGTRSIVRRGKNK
ncbi:hypothetical protein F0U60_32150 [Archangium minus]|uniref:Uncharacterized protein n=1 Tax=Archangium minus TaxID=83450 RepID=A0ABY9WYN9_9BACT|nr:hypothetical protein F0U60_32150 [Archangium minus]